MNKKRIASISGIDLECEIIRYFEKDGKKYLLYSLNEIDEIGYVKLYASKIVDSHARIITDEDEWLLIKDIIKDVVRSNRDGVRVNLNDINEDTLDEIVLEDNRVFKLQGNLVNLLTENKNIYNEEPEVIVEDDYEILYREMVEKNNLLESRLTKLESQLEEYKDKIESIIDIIHS